MHISSSSHLPSDYGASPLQSTKAESSEENTQASSTSNELSTEEEQQVRKMKARDREVRAHEQAHKSAAGD